MTDALRLFLIEDDEDVTLLIRKHLERAHHHVTCCRTGADALIVLGQTTFDLVLLDHGLPDMKGLDLVHQLAREGITVPVLMVTGEGDQQIVFVHNPGTAGQTETFPNLLGTDGKTITGLPDDTVFPNAAKRHVLFNR